MNNKINNNLDLQYCSLIKEVIDNGVSKQDRTGTGTKSLFGGQIRHKMSNGFPLLTFKKMAWKTMVTELLWFLRGETNIKFLVDNDCHIWDGDAYQAYCKKYCELDERHKIEYGSSYYNHETNEYEFEAYSKEEFIDYIKTDDDFANKWGSLGKIYGHSWRNWDGKTKEEFIQKLKKDKEFNNEFGNKGIDQISELIRLLKENPDSRRMVVSAWAVHDLPHQVLPPCHYGFQVYTREFSKDERMDYWFKNHKPNRDVCDSVDESSEEEQHKYFDRANVPKRAISLMFNMRSTDVGLGLPFNLASYGLLLMMLGKQVNMVPDELIFNGGDVHIYNDHIEPLRERLDNINYYNLPTVELTKRVVDDLSEYAHDDIKLKNYHSNGKLTLPLSN